MSRNNRIRGLMALAGLAMSTAAFGQVTTVVEPVVGNFEYIGQGNAGDSSFVYVTFSGLALGGVVETAGFDITYAQADGTAIGGVVNIADGVANSGAGLVQQIAGGGDGDNNVETGETWRIDIAAALGGAIPAGAALVRITFDPAGTPAPTAANADGTNAGGNDALDGRLQIITTRSAPASALFDGTGAGSQMFVTYTTPTVGFVSPNVASIPLFGDQTVNGTAVPSANSVQIGGGGANDFEFTDGNNFNANAGLAGTTDITAGTFAQPGGSTNVLNWTFDDTGSNLKGGLAFRRAVVGDGPTVRDSAGNLVTDVAVAATQLQPLAVQSVELLNDTVSGNPGVVEVTYNGPLNPAAVGNVAFYRDANGGGNSIRRITNGAPVNVGNLDVTAVAFDAAQPTRVRLTVNDASSGANQIGADAQANDGTGDTYEMSFDAAVGTVPQRSFGATPAFQAAQNASLAILDGVSPQVVDTQTQDTNGDGVLDGVLLVFNEGGILATGATGFELSTNAGVNTFPVNLIDPITGELPAALPTVNSATLTNNILPIAAGNFSVPNTGSGVSVADFDADGDGTIDPNEVGRAVLVTYNARTKDWDNDGQTADGGDTNEALPDTAATNAVTLFFNATTASVVNGATTTNVASGAGVLADAAGNAFTNFTGAIDTTAPFDAVVPATLTTTDGTDGASPVLVNICHQPGDNSPDNGNVEPLSDAQLLFEQDLTVGDQKQNDLVRFVLSENLLGGIDTVTVTENLLTYGSAGDTFGGDNNDNGNDDFLNNNSDGFAPAFPNVAVFRPLNATDPTTVVPGQTYTLVADTPGRGWRDGNNNQTSFTNQTSDDCAAPYFAHYLDANNVAQAGVFLVPDASGDFAEFVQGTATQPIDPATIDAADFAINFGGTVTDVEVDADDPTTVRWTLGGADIGINNTVTFTYNGGNPGATLVAAAAPPDGTGVAVSAANSGALDGTGANAVRAQQDPWQDAIDVAVRPVVVNGLDLNGNPWPINTKVFAFNAIPIVREITADHNNVPFTYRTDDHTYNNDIGTLFSSVYPSLNAFTSWLHGVRSEVYLHRNRRNDQVFSNTKVNPFVNPNNTINSGDTGSDNSVVVDSIRVAINAGRLTAITFSGRGETSADAIRSGRLDLAWDVIRSFNGTMDNYRRFGYAWGARPVPAGVGVVDNGEGRVNMQVSRPISRFGGSNRFDSIAQPLIFVAELPNGDRYALSSVLRASNTNDHNGDGVVGDPVLFNAFINQANNNDGTAADALVLNFDLRRVGSHVVHPEWNLIPLDRVGGVVAGAASNLPVLPAGVASNTINSYNTAQFPYANPLSGGVFWAEAGAGFNGLGNPLIGAYDGKWTAADDRTGPFDTIGLDPDLTTHFAFTLTTRGVQLGNGITSLVGGYGVAYYNNADLAGNSNLSTFGVFQFGAPLAQTAVFASNPISSNNNRAGNGWILGAVTNPFDPASGFFAANPGSDYLIAFRNNGRNPATGNTTVLIDVSSLDGAGGANNPNDLDEAGVGGSEAFFIHYDN